MSASEIPDSWYDSQDKWGTAPVEEYFTHQYALQVGTGIMALWSQRCQGAIDGAREVDDPEPVVRLMAERRAELPLGFRVEDIFTAASGKRAADFFLVKLDPASGWSGLGMSVLRCVIDNNRLIQPTKSAADRDETVYNPQQRKVLVSLLRWQQRHGLLLPYPYSD